MMHWVSFSIKYFFIGYKTSKYFLHNMRTDISYQTHFFTITTLKNQLVVSQELITHKSKNNSPLSLFTRKSLQVKIRKRKRFLHGEKSRKEICLLSPTSALIFKGAPLPLRRSIHAAENEYIHIQNPVTIRPNIPYRKLLHHEGNNMSNVIINFFHCTI